MFNLNKVCDRVYSWEFDSQFDMCLHAIRVSEFIESGHKLFESCDYELVDYIDWYSNNINKKGVFSYTSDWGGFNIPSDDLKKAYEDHTPKDFNRVDHLVYGIYKYLRCKEGGEEFYIIAYTKGDDDTFEHEFAHALYKIDLEYKKEMICAISTVPTKARNNVRKILKEKLHYGDAVIDDEFQAYFATGLSDEFTDAHETYRDPFIKTYKKYRRKHLTTV